MVETGKNKSNKLVNPICKNCWRWTTFGKDCHYFWKNKKECSQFMDDEESEPRYIKEVENDILRHTKVCGFQR